MDGGHVRHEDAQRQGRCGALLVLREIEEPRDEVVLHRGSGYLRSFISGKRRTGLSAQSGPYSSSFASRSSSRGPRNLSAWRRELFRVVRRGANILAGISISSGHAKGCDGVNERFEKLWYERHELPSGEDSDRIVDIEIQVFLFPAWRIILVRYQNIDFT